MWLMRLQGLLHFRRQHCNGNAAGHFAGVVAAHTIGKYGHADFRLGCNTVFIMRTHHARISGGRELK